MDDLKRAIRFALCLVTFSLMGCATVRPQDRAILADPVMQYHLDARAHAALDHVHENREGSFGGGSVKGGGCGCN